MNIHDGKFASKVSRSLFWRVLDSMSDSLADADFAGVLAPVVHGRVCRDFGWDGVCDDVNHIRTVVVWNPSPFSVKHVRLISGRNSPDYSFDVKNVHVENPNKIGEMILGIWNARFEKEASLFSDLRTALLIRDPKMECFSVSEIATRPFDPKEYKWDWNGANNIEGYEIKTDRHCFTWQTHGAQFTVLPKMPDRRLKIRLRRPPVVGREFVLNKINFDPSWVEIVK